MANPKNQTGTQANVTTHSAAAGEREVLYQKMGDRWFAFSLIDEEVFVGSITQEEIDQTEKMKLFPVTGNA